jgi:hypothetical protein
VVFSWSPGGVFKADHASARPPKSRCMIVAHLPELEISMEICIDESKLKELMKQALVEVIEDRKEVIYDILSEVIEDIGLAHAIKEGEATESVDKKEILNILQGGQA